MIKNMVKLEIECQGKVCTFLCDNDTPIPVIKECLCTFMKHVGNLEDQILEQQKQQKDLEQSVKIEDISEVIDEIPS